MADQEGFKIAAGGQEGQNPAAGKKGKSASMADQDGLKIAAGEQKESSSAAGKKKRRGRPPRKNPPLEQLTVRVEPGTREGIKAVAELNQTTEANIIRFCLADRMGDYLRSIVFLDSTDAREVGRLIYLMATEAGDIDYQMNKIGVNFNQSVKHLNEFFLDGGYYAEGLEMSRAHLKELSELVGQLEKILGEYREVTKELSEVEDCLSRKSGM